MRNLLFGGEIAKSATLEKGKDLTINLNRDNELKTLWYDIQYKITHDNAAAITTDVFKFVKNIVSEMSLITGTGTSHFDNNTTEMILLQLWEMGKIKYSLDKTSGTGKVSIITIRWNFILPKEYKYPMDSAFNTGNSNFTYLQLKIKPQRKFDSVTDCTVQSVEVKLLEKLKDKPKRGTAEVVINDKLTKVYVPEQAKMLEVKDHGYNSSSKSVKIEPDEDMNILGFYAFVVDENNDIKADCINGVTIKNSNVTYLSGTFDEFAELLDDRFENYDKDLFANVMYVDIANGQLGEGMNTQKGGPHTNTNLYFDLTAQAGTNNLQVVYVVSKDAPVSKV